MQPEACTSGSSARIAAPMSHAASTYRQGDGARARLRHVVHKLAVVKLHLSRGGGGGGGGGAAGGASSDAGAPFNCYPAAAAACLLLA